MYRRSVIEFHKFRLSYKSERYKLWVNSFFCILETEFEHPLQDLKRSLAYSVTQVCKIVLCSDLEQSFTKIRLWSCDIIHESREKSLEMHESCWFCTGAMRVIHMKLIAGGNREPTW